MSHLLPTAKAPTPLPTPSVDPSAPAYFPSMVTWVLTEIVVAEVDPAKVTLEHCRAVVAWEFEGRDDSELALALLPDRVAEKEFYSLKELAKVAGSIRASYLSYHAAELWPKRRRSAGNGNYRFSIQDATQLLRRYYYLGKNKFERSELEALVAERVLRQIQRRHRVRPALSDITCAPVTL